MRLSYAGPTREEAPEQALPPARNTVETAHRDGRGDSFDSPKFHDFPSSAAGSGKVVASTPVTVLVVEGHVAARWSTKLALESSSDGQFHVLTAGDRRHALKLFRRQLHDISLVVLDLELPGRQVARLLGQLRKLRSEIPLIAVTCTPPLSLDTAWQKQPPHALLLKPFDGQVLVETVRAALGTPAQSRSTAR